MFVEFENLTKLEQEYCNNHVETSPLYYLSLGVMINENQYLMDHEDLRKISSEYGMRIQMKTQDDSMIDYIKLTECQTLNLINQTHPKCFMLDENIDVIRELLDNLR